MNSGQLFGASEAINCSAVVLSVSKMAASPAGGCQKAKCPSLLNWVPEVCQRFFCQTSRGSLPGGIVRHVLEGCFIYCQWKAGWTAGCITHRSARNKQKGWTIHDQPSFWWRSTFRGNNFKIHFLLGCHGHTGFMYWNYQPCKQWEIERLVKHHWYFFLSS